MEKNPVVYYGSGFLTVERAIETGHEIVRTTDSVGVLIYIPQKQSVVLISQARSAMISDENPTGTSTEVVAGRFDVALGIRALAVKEIKEEAGIRVSEQDIVLINDGKPVSLAPGVLTERMYLAYVEISERQMAEVSEDHVFGVHSEGERISRKLIPVHTLQTMSFDNMFTMALVQWFLRTVTP